MEAPGPSCGGHGGSSWPLGATRCTLWEILAQYADWPMRGGWGCHNGQDGVQGPGADPREQGWGLGAPASWGPAARPAPWLTTQMRALPTLTGCEPGLEAPGSAEPLPRAPMQPGTAPFPQERLEAARQASSGGAGNRAAPWAQAAADLGELADLERCGGRRLRGSGSSCRR